MLLACVLLFAVAAAPTSEQPTSGSAGAILSKTRDIYRDLPTYHFKRVCLVEEAKPGSDLAKVVQLTLVTATDGAKRLRGEESLPINLDRCRLEIQSEDGAPVAALVSDGQVASEFSARTGEMRTGKDVIEVSSSVGASMLGAFLFFPFHVLNEGVLKNTTVLGEETIEAGEQRRACYKIHASLKPTPAYSLDDEPPSDTMGVHFFVSMLSLMQLRPDKEIRMYTSGRTEGMRIAAGEPTDVTLWIDKENAMLVRSKQITRIYKATAQAAQRAEAVTVSITDTFVTMQAGTAVSRELFRFAPPPGTKVIQKSAKDEQSK